MAVAPWRTHAYESTFKMICELGRTLCARLNGSVDARDQQPIAGSAEPQTNKGTKQVDAAHPHFKTILKLSMIIMIASFGSGTTSCRTSAEPKQSTLSYGNYCSFLIKKQEDLSATLLI